MPLAFPARPSLVFSSRFPSIGLVPDNQRIFIKHCRLKTCVRTHIRTNLFPRKPSHNIGARRSALRQKLRTVVETSPSKISFQRVGASLKVKNESPRRQNRNHNPQNMSECLFPYFFKRKGRLVELHPRVAVPLDETFNFVVNIGPHRLKAKIAAPHTPQQRSHKEKGHRREDQEFPRYSKPPAAKFRS
jgi:hypothetical protein